MKKLKKSRKQQSNNLELLLKVAALLRGRNMIHVDYAYMSEGEKLYQRGLKFMSISYDAENKILVARDEYFKVYTFYDVVELEICGG